MGIDSSAAAKKPKTDEKVPKKDEGLKHAGSKTNNRINERDLKNQKDKDCSIY